MRTATATLAVICLALTGCSSSQPDPDPAACKKAIQAQYEPGTAKLKGQPGTPKQCDGLSTDEVSRIALEVIQENTQ